MGRPLLLLETIGAKSGQKHTVMLGWFPDIDDDGWLVVASYAGAARHPSWFLNMARDPEHVWIEIDKHRYLVRPESLKGDERATAWQRIASLSPGYGRYQTKTDREIPIIRLRRQAEVAS